MDSIAIEVVKSSPEVQDIFPALWELKTSFTRASANKTNEQTNKNLDINHKYCITWPPPFL